jgi:hypothetical protein
MAFVLLRFVHPPGKPMIPKLPRCQEFGIAYYSLTLDALDLGHPRLSLNWGQSPLLMQFFRPHHSGISLIPQTDLQVCDDPLYLFCPLHGRGDECISIGTKPSLVAGLYKPEIAHDSVQGSL